MNRRGFIHSMIVGGAATGDIGVAAAPRPAAQEVRLGTFRVIITEPERPRGSAVVLLPTIAGVDSYMSLVAATLARDGYVVATWDPYDGRTVPPGTPARLALSKTVRDDDAMTGVRAAVDHLTGAMKLKAVAMIGWCLGGRYALLHGGLDRRVAAIASYNPTIYSPTPVTVLGAMLSKADFQGQTLDEFPLARRIACAVQVARPGNDLAQPAEYDKLQQALYARTAATRIDYFPEATHGFTYQPRNDADRSAAAIAWAGTMALLTSTIG